ncbi:unnamed protein product [Brassica oleracea]
MEASAASVTVSVAIAAVLRWIWRALNWVWFKPKMLESYLRRQGLVGTPYTLLVGDVKREYSMTTEARSKPIKLTDDIVPRVLPFPSHMLKTYGRFLDSYICFNFCICMWLEQEGLFLRCDKSSASCFISQDKRQLQYSWSRQWFY